MKKFNEEYFDDDYSEETFKLKYLIEDQINRYKIEINEVKLLNEVY